MRYPVTVLLACAVACSDAAKNPTETPGNSTPSPVADPVLVQATLASRGAAPNDTILVQGDTVAILRTYPLASCCLRALIPTLSVHDSTLHLTLMAPDTAVPSGAGVLRFGTIVRRGSAHFSRLIQELRYPNALVFSDTIPLPQALPAALPPLWTAVGFLPTGASMADTIYATYDSTLHHLRVEGSVRSSGADSYYRPRLAVGLGGNQLTLGICCEAVAFAGVTHYVFRTQVQGLPPGRYAVLAGWEWALDTLTVEIPAGAP